MAARLWGKRVRLGALAAACAAMVALAVTLGLTQRDDANPSTCTARTLGVSPASNPGLAADCDALLATKSTLGVSGWSAGSALRDWRGVTLGGTPQRVTGLDLSDNRLTGSIPAQLGGLTALAALDLSGNMLGGDLPAGLRDMPPTLATLRLAGNMFTGCIDERLRLAETNDLAALMTARGLRWCPVAAMPDGELAGGTWQIDGTLIVDVPAMGPRVKRYETYYSEPSGPDDVTDSGVWHCLSDMAEQEALCMDESWGKSYRYQINESVSGMAATSGLRIVFDKIEASARAEPRAGEAQRGDANPLTCTARPLGVPRASNPGLAADCDALLAIRAELRVSGWSADSALRHWRGVTLGGTPQRVTGLDLSDNRLSGSIPAQLGSLTALTVLDLSGNMLGGHLPAGLRDLPPTLATLYLAGNSFTGCIDERLRLAETNDLAMLMTARGLSWCPVVAASKVQPLAAGTYHIDDEIIIDIPASGPRVKLFAMIIASTSGGGGGIYHCLSDVGEQKKVCFSAHTGDEGVRGPAHTTSRPGASGAGDPAPPAGLETVFDKIAATVRVVP